MSSPFTTLEEFNAAIDGPTGGAIYTFAQSPVINVIALLAAVGIFVWFMIATYSSHSTPSSSVDKSLNHLSTFIVVGLLSFVAAAQQHSLRHPSTPEDLNQTAQNTLNQRRSYQQASRQLPMGLLGMVGASLPQLRRVSRHKSGRRSTAYFSRRNRSHR